MVVVRHQVHQHLVMLQKVDTLMELAVLEAEKEDIILMVKQVPHMVRLPHLDYLDKVKLHVNLRKGQHLVVLEEQHLLMLLEVAEAVLPEVLVGCMLVLEDVKMVILVLLVMLVLLTQVLEAVAVVLESIPMLTYTIQITMVHQEALE